MKIGLLRLVLAAALLCCANLGLAKEAILNYHSDVVVHVDGSLEVTEHITVRAEGNQIRRGIYRDFPTRYRDARGDLVIVDFEVLGVERDGQREPWFTEQLSNGVRINTGDDSFLRTPLETTYSIRYRTNRQLGFFDTHDEIYWNVTGSGWIFPIHRASARVVLPKPVHASELRLDYYTGRQGSRLRNARAEVPEPGVVEFATTARLGAQEGLTVSVGFPKGVVAAPTALERTAWFFKDNRPQLILILGLIGLLVYYLIQWRAKGKDPAPGPIFPHYYPPQGFSPGGLRYLLEASYDDRCFAADLVNLAVHGLLTIRKEKEFLGHKWIVQKQRKPVPEDLTPSESALYKYLFSHLHTVELEQANHEILAKAKSEHLKALAKRFKPKYVVDNARTVVVGSLVSVALFAVAYFTATYFTSWTLWVLVGAIVVLNLVFLSLMRQPTPEGRRLLDHIEGLKLYLKVADKDDIARLEHRQGDEPPLNAERFEMLLPFALALDVEDAWTNKFIGAVGITEADSTRKNLGWYHAGMGGGGLRSLGSDLGGALSSQISSSSTPPGSSSGGGGGGSSGGGGGGGGGGGR